MKTLIKRTVPAVLWDKLGSIRQGLKRANIIQPTGMLDVMQGEKTFVLVVGPSFDQNLLNAMMVCRMGYCRAFESMGIPYLIADVRDVATISEVLPSPFFMYFAADLDFMPQSHVSILKKHPSAVWVYPWFSDSLQFFTSHGLDPKIWTLPTKTLRKVLELSPRFAFSATMPSGLSFFAEWENNGIPVKSLPLACDTHVYKTDPDHISEFQNISLAFVGGYWESKGREIDRYLRQHENHLHVYGYNKWPYSGYKGKLPLELETSLYHQARICPVVNEPSVALLKGQINERVFKVLGSMGCPVVDAVSAYRELYSEDELLISDSPAHFAELVELLLNDSELNQAYRERGCKATLERHTYKHRALDFMRYMDI